jgi:succinate-acetate transporter protein
MKYGFKNLTKILLVHKNRLSSSFVDENISITFSLKLLIFFTNFCSIDNIASAVSLSWSIVFLKKFFILLSVEKQRSHSEVVIGMFKSLYVSKHFYEIKILPVIRTCA